MALLTGKHLIDGNWVGGSSSFTAQNPATNQPLETEFHNADPALVDLAVARAGDAAQVFASLAPSARAAFLRRIADEIDARGAELTEIAQLETALPAQRLNGERGRTVGQLRFFADWIEEGHWLDARIDHALPAREPLPRPDLRSCNQALGPVAVFGASNFPLAFSTAGGDTASALAAGCPVIVKAHPAHPGTSEIVAQAILAAIEACAIPPGVFALVQGGDLSVGQALVAHPGIRAVGFTGSLAGGRALYDIATSRPDPIPFYGELGSNNPVYLLPDALEWEADRIAEGWAASLTMGVGQFCTNPGIVLAVAGTALERFKSTAVAALKAVPAQPMLTGRIAESYRAATHSHQNDTRLRCLLPAAAGDLPLGAAPAVYAISAETWSANPELGEEIFGPAAIIVECRDSDEMLAIARGMHGQLTSTLFLKKEDSDLAAILLPDLERSSGRVLVNGFPTGVEVCHAMVHGGPYPASTDSGSTSVGSLAIRRFLRPVCYQDLPDQLLPAALREGNPLGIPRLVNGRLA